LRSFKLLNWCRYYIEDALEELDEEGEFYYDRQSRKLTYLPLPHEQLGLEGSDEGAFEAWAPQLITPVSIKAAHVTVKDLSLLHAAADMDGFFKGDCDGQSATNLKTGALDLSCNCSGIVVTNVEVAHTGGFGVITHGALQDTVLSRLLVHDVGAGGVNVKEPPMGSVQNLTLLDSQIFDGGHVWV
jgi:hypothetical protein